MSTGSPGRLLPAPPFQAGSPRPRRYLPAPLLMALRPLFRYSDNREAYVLRLVGHTRGPVLKRRSS